MLGIVLYSLDSSFSQLLVTEFLRYVFKRFCILYNLYANGSCAVGSEVFNIVL